MNSPSTNTFSLNIFIATGSVFLFTSACSLPTYFPSTVNAPQLSEKGQVTGSAGIGENIEIKGAYAATRHLGLIIDYTSTTANEGADPLAGVFNYTETEDHKQNMFHAGMGYFNTHKKFTYETFAGFATGNADHSYRAYNMTSNQGFDLEWKMKRIFLCGDAGFKFKNFAAGFAFRVNYSMFDPYYAGFDNQTSSSYSSNNKKYNKNLDILNVEPGFYLRAGFKNVKLNLELTFSNVEEKQWFLNSGGTAQIGLLFDLYTIENDKTTEEYSLLK